MENVGLNQIIEMCEGLSEQVIEVYRIHMDSYISTINQLEHRTMHSSAYVRMEIITISSKLWSILLLYS